jgi:hypothetical protein
MEPVNPVRVAVQLGPEQVTVVVVACLTERAKVPELAALFESPGYEAFIVTVPPVAPVAVIVQVPPTEREQVAELRVTVPVPDCDQVIVSPVTEPANPATVAVHVEAAPITIGDGEHETVVVVVLRAQVTLAEFELPVWSKSPP